MTDVSPSPIVICLFSPAFIDILPKVLILNCPSLVWFISLFVSVNFNPELSDISRYVIVFPLNLYDIFQFYLFYLIYFLEKSIVKKRFLEKSVTKKSENLKI